MSPLKYVSTRDGNYYVVEIPIMAKKVGDLLWSGARGGKERAEPTLYVQESEYIQCTMYVHFQVARKANPSHYHDNHKFQKEMSNLDVRLKDFARTITDKYIESC